MTSLLLWNKPRSVECCHFSYPSSYNEVSSAGPRSRFKRGNITTHPVRATCLSTKRVYHSICLTTYCPASITSQTFHRSSASGDVLFLRHFPSPIFANEVIGREPFLLCSCGADFPPLKKLRSDNIPKSVENVAKIFDFANI